MKRILITLGLSSLLFACATTKTTIIPNSDGTYTMSATDSTEAEALNGGIAAASKACQAENKSLAVISHSTKYTGGKIDHDTKDVLNTASTFAMNLSGHGARNVIDTSNDYTVTLKYRCN